MKSSCIEIRLALVFLSIMTLAGCGQQKRAAKADPDKTYPEEGWNGAAYADYRNLDDAVFFGPFDTAEQCVSAIKESGSLESDASVFECCSFDPNYDDGLNPPQRFKLCRHNFDDWEYFDPCVDPDELCNERGRAVASLIEIAQENVEIRNEEIDASVQEMLDPRSSPEIKSAAKDRFYSAFFVQLSELTGIYARIRSDSGAKSRGELEEKLAAAYAASTSDDDRALIGEALTRINRPLIDDALADIIDPALTLVDEKAAAAPTLAMGTAVDAVLFNRPKQTHSDSNHIFDRMTAQEIAESAGKLSKVGVIRVRQTAEQDVFYICEQGGVGNAYRLKFELAAVDLKKNQVTGVKTLVGGPPPEKIESYVCEGVGEPPDWSGYFTVAD